LLTNEHHRVLPDTNTHYRQTPTRINEHDLADPADPPSQAADRHAAAEDRHAAAEDRHAAAEDRHAAAADLAAAADRLVAAADRRAAEVAPRALGLAVALPWVLVGLAVHSAPLPAADPIAAAAAAVARRPGEVR